MHDAKKPDRDPAARYTPSELARWRLLIHELPEVRSEKVEATRQALLRPDFDNAEVIDATLARLQDDLRAVCSVDAD